MMYDMKLTYTYKWDNIDWFAEPTGSDEIKKKLDELKVYLTYDRKQSMSKSEVKLYDWILKKQYKADPIELIDWDYQNSDKHVCFYWLSYYNPSRKLIVSEEEKYAKQQQKNRARFHSKMGR